ncbi:MAG: hypothetical protein IPK16_08315 [Anaerolineales bacterium]|nr:hypothetical protein [Anaerolineales bacterium]
MPYTRGQVYQICQAIEPAYNRDTMRQMTAHCMTADFDAHAGEKGFSDQLWEFACWANRKGKALELVRCAATNNPGNDGLQALYTAMQAWPVEPAQSTRTPTGPVALFDLAHGQTHWGELAKRRNLAPKDRPMLDIGYSEFAAMLHQRGWTPLENKRQFSPKALAAARLLVLTLPLDKQPDAHRNERAGRLCEPRWAAAGAVLLRRRRSLRDESTRRPCAVRVSAE